MPTCRVCGESMPDGTRTCKECGSALPDLVPTARIVAPPTTKRVPTVAIPPKLPQGGRYCPSCGTVYDADYTDSFCICGTELVGTVPGSHAPAAPTPEPVAPVPVVKPAIELPPAGTRCLVLYGPDRQPLHYFPLTKDATLIGRLDAPAGNFPDVDLDDWLDSASTRKISRQHVLVLRSRATGGFSLRPLAGNTGTQLDAEMVLPEHDYPLTADQRVILGGVARFKFEIV
jgi:Double zinc ribbon/FHA domain